MSGSKLIKRVAERSLIPLNSLLLFFLLFEPRIVLPGWLQVFGRMHPLALHFPIVLILIYAVVTLFFPSMQVCSINKPSAVSETTAAFSDYYNQ